MKSPDCYHLNTQHAPENTLTGTNRGPDTCESSHTRSNEQTHNLTVNSNLSDNCQLKTAAPMEATRGWLQKQVNPHARL